jgi:CelD/BcsL family acetyltransferase involved in cellulose biosynthesis
MFQSFAWNETAARVFGGREPARVIVVENDSGAAIVPACCRQGMMGPIGERLFDYRDVLWSDGSLLATAWEKIAELGLPFLLTALRGAESVGQWEGLSVEPFANAPAVLLGDISADQFLLTHNRLGRYSRRIRKHGIDLHRRAGSDRDLIRTIYELKGTQGTPESNLFSDPLRREFMVEICAHPETGCEMFSYETAGQIVAALVTFRDNSWRRFYTVYYDQRWAALSPGQVLLFEITARSLAEGLDCDFMTGEYPYKLRLATDLVPLYCVSATPEELRDAARRKLAIASLAA